MNARVVGDCIAAARKQLKSDWDVDRPRMIAELLSRLATLQQQARMTGRLHIVLGRVSTPARVTWLVG
jgi:hypothetical protein